MHDAKVFGECAYDCRSNPAPFFFFFLFFPVSPLLRRLSGVLDLV